MRPRVALRALVALTSTGLLLSGCVRMPEDGPVVETSRTASAEGGQVTSIDPLPPLPGASAVQVAEGFLEAMTATPIRTSVAQEYLAQDARTSWSPDSATIIYDEARPPVPVGGGAQIRLASAERLDARGAWVGELPSEDSTLSLQMTLEDGELRITNPPNALVVPASWFEQRFAEVSLYFFDRTSQILVPEPVFVPRGEQLLSTLIEGLLAGPAAGPRPITRTFLPSGLDVALAVPISAEGVADIALTGDAPPRSTDANALMLAQLAWTLRQDPSVRSLRVSIGGQQVALPDGVPEYRVDGGAEYDPTGYQSSTLLYGLTREGLMVSGNQEGLTPVSGPLGRTPHAVRSLATDLRGNLVVAVTRDGRSLLRAPVRREAGRRQRVEEVVGEGEDLLTPAWDAAGRIWFVDRTADGARVRYVVGDRVRELDVPGITGRDVRSFVVSRDTTRLVAVVRGREGDRLHTARVLIGDQGRVLGSVRSAVVAPEDGTRLRAQDLVWSSPTTVSLVSRVRDDLSEVRTVTVDGAPAGLSALSTTVKGPVRRLVGSPVPGLTLYGLTRDGLVDVGRGTVSTAAPGLRDLGYAG